MRWLSSRSRRGVSRKIAELSVRIAQFLTSSGVAFGEGAFRTTAMKRLALLILVVGFGLGACERHDFKETRKLHDHHGHEHVDHSEKNVEHAEKH